MIDRHDIFSFEFHSLIPVSDCKTINEAQETTTVKLFGRTRNYESVCAHVIGHLPYFYILPDGSELDSDFPFGNKKSLEHLGIHENSFKITTVEKIPFYNFHEGSRRFAKVECCSEFVRKKLVNFIKDSPNLYFTLYESHISFALQFMSDLAIVGMGLVHVKSPVFLEICDKTTTCGIECSLKATDIINNRLMSEANSSQSLLPSLSLFMENLGVSDLVTTLNITKDSSESTNSEMLTDLWPSPSEHHNKANYASKLKCPKFRNYIFRQPPPVEIEDYSPVAIKEISTSSEGFSNSSFYYTPAHDPPVWKGDKEKLPRRNIADKHIIENLSLSLPAKDSYPIYEYNGDFYLKLIALECYVFKSELEMISELVDIIMKEDPDVLAGYDVDNRSWGKVANRFNELGHDSNLSFQLEISRTSSKSKPVIDEWMARASSQFQIHGRIVFNLWRIFKDEIPIRLYTICEVYRHYFNKNIPYLSPKSIADLMRTDHVSFMNYTVLNLNCICELITKTPFLVKTIEFSRLFGIDLFSTLTRGSQYRVESILITAAHSENYLLRTPTESDVRTMRAAQGLPLTMEPISSYYRDPVVVLDFQSLYPSMIIAYNFCYTTIIGTMVDDKVVSCGAMASISPKNFNLESFSQIKEYPVFKAPGNIAFVKKDLKIGLIPRLLNEILSSRVAIKNAMKSCDKKVKSILDARQLALKYISNMTYGYTSASFSGRMPNVDIADAIVLSGRKTLERAIDIIESHSKWEAQVIYGDTDSLFILLPGRTLAEAFRLGRDMANAVSSDSPHPVVLKFEKVYFPSVLMSKKRYCGYKHEFEDSPPIFDAKGIETVRRDGCLLSAKILKKALMLLFIRNDENIVKEYVQRQLIKILTYQKINVADFVFAREVRFGTYKSLTDNKIPLSAIAAKNRQARNPRDIVAFGERVPFVIVSKPFSKLYQQVVDLDEFLSGNFRLDVVYYATKQILTVLSRAFSIQGIDVWRWYNELPLAQFKNACNLSNERLFSRSFFLSEVSKSEDSRNTVDTLQAGLRLQDLNFQDARTKMGKQLCCGRQNCMNWSCDVFWDRFNFEHRSAKELAALKQSFELNF